MVRLDQQIGCRIFTPGVQAIIARHDDPVGKPDFAWLIVGCDEMNKSRVAVIEKQATLHFDRRIG